MKKPFAMSPALMRVAKLQQVELKHRETAISESLAFIEFLEGECLPGFRSRFRMKVRAAIDDAKEKLAEAAELNPHADCEETAAAESMEQLRLVGAGLVELGGVIVQLGHTFDERSWSPAVAQKFVEQTRGFQATQMAWKDARTACVRAYTSAVASTGVN